jgi:hypothetical protein
MRIIIHEYKLKANKPLNMELNHFQRTCDTTKRTRGGIARIERFVLW